MASNMPKGDVWAIIDNDSKSQRYGDKFKFDFSYIESKNIKNVVKHYVWRNHREGNLTLSSLKMKLSYLPKVVKFLNQREIGDFKTLTNNDVDLFESYLKTIKSKRGKPYKRGSQRQIFNCLKVIIHWGKLYMPDEVPKREIFTGGEFLGMNKERKIDYIPDEVYDEINRCLISEDNPYLKYGIIILQSTGMRIGDLLLLTTECVKPHLISGYTITWFEHKKRKQRKPLPIPNECVVAVKKLIEETKELRNKADGKIKDYLFIHKPTIGQTRNVIRNIAQRTYDNWLKAFIKKNDIEDSNGELYNLMSQQFRRTLATDMFSKGVNINIIRDVLGHACSSTTKLHYADMKDKERAEITKNIGIIGNINKVDDTILKSPEELKWFKENKDKGARLCDGYCTKPIEEDGQICETLLKRQKCYTCARYITTPEFLEAHKSHLEGLEKQMENNIWGEHYAEHFTPTIEILKVIVKRLEEISDGYKEVAATTDK